MTENSMRRIVERTEALYHDMIKEGSLAGSYMIGRLLGKSSSEVNDDLDKYDKEVRKHARF